MSFGRYRELALLGHGGMARVVLPLKKPQA